MSHLNIKQEHLWTLDIWFVAWYHSLYD